MRYIVYLHSLYSDPDTTFVMDRKARRFTKEYPDAHLFESATEAYAVAKKLNKKTWPVGTTAHCISEKAFAEDCGNDTPALMRRQAE